MADTIDVDNNQDLTTDTNAQTTVNAGDVHDASASAGAMGNTTSVDYANGNVVVVNSQTVDSNTNAGAYVNVDSADTSASASSNAMANSATITACCGAVDATSNQSVAAGNVVNSQAGIDAANWSMNPSVSALGVANTSDVETVYGGALNNALNQTNQADVTTDAYVQGGLVADSATVASTAIGNSGFAGGQQTTVSSAVDQQNHANTIQATSYLQSPDVEDTVVASTATGNNFNIENSWGYVQSYVNQDNSTYVRAQTDASVGLWEHPNTASALAMGNSNLTSNVGSDIYLDNVQLNTGGGVDSVVNWTGGTGGVGSSDQQVINATAIGNAVSAYVCDTCSTGGITAQNRQVNSANISATATVNGGNGGSIISSVMAVGNTATYQSSNSGN